METNTNKKTRSAEMTLIEYAGEIFPPVHIDFILHIHLPNHASSPPACIVYRKYGYWSP